MDSNIKAGFVSGLSYAYGKAGSYARVVSVLFIMFSMLSIFSSGQSQAQNAMIAICNLYNTVHSVIFILGLTLMILGGALYAGAHVMPSQSKGTLQGYAMGMVLGGVIGVIIAVISPYILQLITSNNLLAECPS
ncbi:MAG: hypothetical protein ACP5MX_02175 [Candidatus Micrarchaeia archaeon]